MSKAVQARTPPTSGGGKSKRYRFLHEVLLELRKVKWPSREDTVQLTGLVMVTIVAVGVYVALLDFALGKFFQAIGMYGGGH